MREYYRMPEEGIDSQGGSMNIHPMESKSLGEYIYNLLCDLDPE